MEPDTKDWTWVLERPCPECGFVASELDLGAAPGLVESTAESFRAVLDRDGAAVRPGPTTWSALEYACHVRDVHRIFDGRVRLMLAEDDPEFANWDQDATAVDERYDLQDPATVSAELVAAAAVVAATYASVAEHQWPRTGRRSDGSRFTVASLARYHLHDVVHHVWDVESGPPHEPSVGGG
jgi:hypothetical protein